VVTIERFGPLDADDCTLDFVYAHRSLGTFGRPTLQQVLRALPCLRTAGVPPSVLAALVDARVAGVQTTVDHGYEVSVEVQATSSARDLGQAFQAAGYHAVRPALGPPRRWLGPEAWITVGEDGTLGVPLKIDAYAGGDARPASPD
jgi:hypothetical protein